MREIVAKALYDEIRKHPDPLSWGTAEALARAAIEAMRGAATDEMLKAGCAIPGVSLPTGERMWNAMIAAALSPSREDEGKRG